MVKSLKRNRGRLGLKAQLGKRLRLKELKSSPKVRKAEHLIPIAVDNRGQLSVEFVPTSIIHHGQTGRFGNWCQPHFLIRCLEVSMHLNQKTSLCTPWNTKPVDPFQKK